MQGEALWKMGRLWKVGKALGKVWQGPVEGEESLGRVREALWNLGRLWERLCGKLGRLCGKVYVCWTGEGGGLLCGR